MKLYHCIEIMEECFTNTWFKQKKNRFWFMFINFWLRFNVNSNNFNTRNSSQLRVVRCSLKTSGQKLDHAASTEFNSLPLNLRQSCTLSLFKQKLKKVLMDNVETLLLY